MVLLKEEIPQPPAETLVNYNFLDIVAGVGILTLYGGKTDVGYALSNTIWNSQGAATWLGTITSVADTKEFDENFDVTINTPFVTKGKAIVTVPFSYKTRSTTPNNSGYVIVRLIQVRGGTPTTLVSATGTTIQISGFGAATWFDLVTATELDVPFTQWVKDDILRLEVEVYMWGSGTGNVALGTVWHDPANRTVDDILVIDSANTHSASGDSTVLKIQLPVRIDI